MKSKISLVFFLLLFVITTLSACNHTSRILYDDFKFALLGGDDATLTTEQVISSPYDYIYLYVEHLPRAVLALGFVKGSQYHWVSADQAVVVLQGGRLIASSGLKHNLLHTTNIASDPISFGLSEFHKRNTWSRQTDWDNAAGYELRSRFQPEKREIVTLLGQAIDTVRVDETVQIIGTGDVLLNSFWFDSESGKLIRSIQQPAPDQPKMEFVYLSDIARLYGLKLAERQ